MKQVRENIAKSRVGTDVSLGAERATSDSPSDEALDRRRRANDDLLEHGRMLADERLMKARARADVSLGPMVIDQLQEERDVSDLILQRERSRADANDEMHHEREALKQLEVTACRVDTNDQLCAERGRTDSAVMQLAAKTRALSVSESEAPRRSEILGIVTHDLRSPLCVIALNAQSIIETNDLQLTHELAHEVCLAAARMGRLLTDLLDVVRVDADSLRIIKRDNDVCALVGEVLNSYRPLFAQCGIEFAANAPSHALIAPFDWDRIIQVFSNLLSNALKFTPRGGKVTLDVKRLADSVELTVRDTGSGIAEASLQRVFDRFWQIDNVARRGLGLGLYICDQITRRHGGRIWVESELGKGSTFHFTLPMNAA